MIKLTKMLDMIGDQKVIVCEGEKKLYSGVANKCPKYVSHVTKMEWNNHLERYLIDIRCV